MSDDDNVPYRLTDEYLQAARTAAKQNERQRRGAQYGLSHFPDEPWGIPSVNILLAEVNSPFRPFDSFFGYSLNSGDRTTRSARYLSRLAGHATTWEISYSTPYARAALFEIQHDDESDA